MSKKRISLLLFFAIIIVVSCVYGYKKSKKARTSFKDWIRKKAKTLGQLEQELGIKKHAKKPKKKVAKSSSFKGRVRKKAKTLEQLEKELGIVRPKKERARVRWGKILGAIKEKKKVTRESLRKSFKEAEKKLKNEERDLLQYIDMAIEKEEKVQSKWKVVWDKLAEIRRKKRKVQEAFEKAAKIKRVEFIEKILDITDKIDSKEKSISKAEWLDAKKASEIVPKYDQRITSFLSKEREKAITSAKIIDAMKRQLGSKEKNISKQDWESAKRAVKYIPQYSARMRRILTSKKTLPEIIKAARAIDAFIENVIQKKADVPKSMERREAGLLFGRLPGYKEWVMSAYLKTKGR